MNPKADIALMAAALCMPPMRATRGFALHAELGLSPIEIPGISYRTPNYVPLCRGPRQGPQPLSKAKLKKLAGRKVKP